MLNNKFFFFAIFSLILICTTLKASEKHNIKLEIRSLNSYIKLGDPVPIEFTITNVGEKDYEYTNRNYDRSGRMPEYRLEAFHAKGLKLDDPRESIKWLYMGGLGAQSNIKPKEYYTKVIDLNRWVLIEKSGVYKIVGDYKGVKSEFIKIKIEDRSASELEQYIEKLGDELTIGKDKNKREDLLKKLMYTQSTSIISYILDSTYKDENYFWVQEAFFYYLPKNEQVKKLVLNTNKINGIGGGMTAVLHKLGIDESIMKELIDYSLDLKNKIVISEAVLAAQRYPDEKFLERLINISKSKDYDYVVRIRSLYAMEKFKDYEKVKSALWNLRNDEDKFIRETVTRIIDE